MSENSSSSGGIGFCSLLTILFIGLKLTHVIDWSWWWVLSPIWIPLVILGVVLAVLGVAYLGSKTLLVAVLCIPALAASAQFYNPPPLIAIPPPRADTRLSVDLRPVWTSWALNFKDEAVSSSFKKPSIEFGASIVSNALKVRYAVSPALQMDETIFPMDVIRVAETDFGKKASAGSTDAKPLDLKWSLNIAHRFEVSTAGLFSLPVQPIVVGKSAGYTLTATGEDKDGKQATTSESESRFFVGIGGVLENRTQFVDTRVLGVAGPQYARVEAAALYRLRPEIAISGGYYSETLWFDKLKLRGHGPFLGVAVELPTW
jgi:hypothetical protein